MKSKKCASCGIIKSIEQFQKMRRGHMMELTTCSDCRTIQRARYMENREKIIPRTIEFNKKHAAYRRGYMRDYMRGVREEAMMKLGRRCARCGFDDPRALQIDHVNSDGFAELRGQFSGYKYLKKVIADTDGRYQILCANCNWIKRHDRQEQPYCIDLTKDQRSIISRDRSLIAARDVLSERGRQWWASLTTEQRKDFVTKRAEKIAEARRKKMVVSQ